jgi:hypothetical protein
VSNQVDDLSDILEIALIEAGIQIFPDYRFGIPKLLLLCSTIASKNVTMACQLAQKTATFHNNCQPLNI